MILPDVSTTAIRVCRALKEWEVKGAEFQGTVGAVIRFNLDCHQTQQIVLQSRLDILAFSHTLMTFSNGIATEEAPVGNGIRCEVKCSLKGSQLKVLPCLRVKQDGQYMPHNGCHILQISKQYMVRLCEQVPLFPESPIR